MRWPIFTSQSDIAKKFLVIFYELNAAAERYLISYYHLSLSIDYMQHLIAEYASTILSHVWCLIGLIIVSINILVLLDLLKREKSV